MNLSLGLSLGNPTLQARSSIDQRALQRAAITNGTVIFYWPFDQQDMAVTDSIRVVTANARGAVGTDYSAPLSVLTGTITPSWSDYAMRLNNSYLELAPASFPNTVEAQQAGDMARRLVAGRRAVPSPEGWLLNDEVSELYDYYTIDPRTYAYLFVLQYVKETGVSVNMLWDQYGDTGMVSKARDDDNIATFVYPSGLAPSDITLPAASAAANGEVRTVGWYYDGTANLRYGFRGVGSGDTVTWTAGGAYDVPGAAGPQDISGISSPTGKVQGMLCIEFTTPPSLATVQTAVDQCRANWKAGTKVLPAAIRA